MQGALHPGNRTAVRRLLACAALVLALQGTGCSAAPTSATPVPPAGPGATLSVTVSSAAASGGGVADSMTVTLVRVVDGDTIVVEMPDGTGERVRYIGVDAPESPREEAPGERLAAEARSHNEALLHSGPLRLRFDVRERDDCGRILAYVWAGSVFVNHRMVLDGFATAVSYPPNLTYQSQLMDAQQQARRAGVGVWGTTDT